MKKKYGGLGLVDPEVAKTSLLSKWIVKAMEPGESNLQLMLRYRLARYNPQEGRSWGVSLDWFTNKLHQGFTGSRIWSHIGKAWKSMVEGIYQILPRTRWELLHSNIWWSEGLKLISKGFDHDRGRQLYRHGVPRVEDIWDDSHQNFLTWEQAQSKFHLPSMENEEWLEVIDKVSGQWRQLLESEEDPAYPGQ